MEYSELIKRLSQRGLFRIKPELTRVHGVLKTFGDPQDACPSIHIAGTNGKGSTAASLESILRHAGYRTGLYTSPHLQNLRERIQIDRQLISEKDFLRVAKDIMAREKTLGYALTYFEFLTVMAFVYFARQQVDVRIMEAGMGGRWDATNVIRQPIASVITSIGMDHRQWLGKTASAIAKEKAGIIKTGSPVICGARGAPARVIESAARAAKTDVYRIDKDFRAHLADIDWHAGRQHFDYQGLNSNERNGLVGGLMGLHQADNAAIALACIDVLQNRHWNISKSAVAAGLHQVHWSGRCQIFDSRDHATVIFDGAHNPPAIRELAASLQSSPWRKSAVVFVTAFYRDKDFRGILKIIGPLSARILACTLPGKRALPAARLLAYSKSVPALRGKVEVIAHPRQALHTALTSTDSSQLVVITGSLALVGMLLPDLVKKSANQEVAMRPAPAMARATLRQALRRNVLSLAAGEKVHA